MDSCTQEDAHGKEEIAHLDDVDVSTPVCPPDQAILTHHRDLDHCTNICRLIPRSVILDDAGRTTMSAQKRDRRNRYAVNAAAKTYANWTV